MVIWLTDNENMRNCSHGPFQEADISSVKLGRDVELCEDNELGGRSEQVGWDEVEKELAADNELGGLGRSISANSSSNKSLQIQFYATAN